MTGDESKQPELKEHPLQQHLDFSFSSFGKPQIDIDGGIIVLPIREFKVYSGFPGYDKSIIVLDGELIFEGVADSVREIAEYEDAEQTTYNQRYTIEDGPFSKPEGTPHEFYLGGFSHDPPGWIEWYIDVVSVKVREHISKPADPQ
jgi:hypothetical protein